MREIKFRAWDKENGKMRDVYSLHGSRSAHCYMNNTSVLFPRDSIELMQYTGLKDKNRKEIYEGDVVRDTLNETYVWQVCWDRAEFAICHLTNKDDEGRPEYEDLLSYERVDGRWEVIGNIYENPELLE